MKKYSWILALLLALAMVFVGCPESGGGKDKEKEGEEEGDGPKIVKTVTLADNFQYGKGYQGYIDGIFKLSNNLTGAIAGKVTKDDVFAMRFKFTADRELEDDITIGLVDRVTNYWQPLTYDKDADDFEPEDDDAMTVLVTKAEINAGEVTVELEITALKSAPDSADASNSLVFETRGAGSTGTAGSGKEGPVKLEFTVFQFIKGSIEDLPEEPTEPVEPVEPAREEYVIENPEFAIIPGASHSQWVGDSEAADDGSWTFKAGGLRYKWPDATAEFDVDDYDFVEVEYTVEGLASSVVKQYAVGDDYTPFGASNANLPASGKFTLELRNAASGGFAIQKWGGDANMTINFTKLIFYKGNRLTITLDPGEGTVDPETTYLVEDTRVGSHLPIPTRDGFNFIGWKLGDTTLTATTLVDSSFAGKTLVAAWAEIVPAPPLPVTFTNVSEIEGNEVTLVSGAFSFTNATGGNYGTVWAKFTVDFGDYSLADYDKVAFTLSGTGGDSGYKNVALLAAATLPAGGTYVTQATNQVSISETNNYTSGAITVTLVLDKSKTSAFPAGELEVGIYVHAPADQVYTVSNIIFSQDD